MDTFYEDFSEMSSQKIVFVTENSITGKQSFLICKQLIALKIYKHNLMKYVLLFTFFGKINLY